MDIIDKLKLLKKEKGYTLEYISKNSNISLGTINKLFSGAIKSVKSSTLEKLVKVFDVSLDQLLKEDHSVLDHCNNKFGYVKCGAFSGDTRVCDVDYNVASIISNIDYAQRKGVNVAVFPELCISSYSAGDLIFQPTMIDNCLKGLKAICEHSKKLQMLIFVGLPFKNNDKLYNVACAVCNGEVLAIIPKRNLPNYNEFYEKRYFCEGNEKIEYVTLFNKKVPFGTNIILENSNLPNLRVACEICEDIWVPNSPSYSHCLHGANIIVNLSASNETAGKCEYRRKMVSMQASKCLCGYVYTSCGSGESTSDVVFSAHNVISEAGRTISESQLFGDGIAIGDIDVNFLQFERGKKFHFDYEKKEYERVVFDCAVNHLKLDRVYSPTPFVPKDKVLLEQRCKYSLDIQVQGLMKRIQHTNCKKLVVGVSGGLDSALAMIVCAKALKKLNRPANDLVAITMPCFGTTSRTKSNAEILSEQLNATFMQVDISNSVKNHLQDINQDVNDANVTYENAQARERTQVLMDYANKVGGLVIGTGDLSEIALGWSTYNGDHMSMYAVNCGVPKTLIQAMVRFVANNSGKVLADCLLDIVDTPISPELKPSDNDAMQQLTEDIIGPYQLHDFFLYYFVKKGFEPSKIYYVAKNSFKGIYDNQTIKKWLKTFVNRFFTQQFKRSCSPDGVKVGSLSLSPRGDWRMPSDAVKNIWLNDIDSIID